MSVEASRRASATSAAMRGPPIPNAASAGQSRALSGFVGSSCPVTRATAEASSRWVTGIPAYADAATAWANTQPSVALEATWRIIRETNPTRIVFANCYFWANAERLAELELPAEDPNVVAQFQRASNSAFRFICTAIIIPYEIPSERMSLFPMSMT